MFLIILKHFFECVPKAFGRDDKKAEKMDKKSAGSIQIILE